MPADSDSLYGIARPRRRPANVISSSTSAAFTTQLSSLLSASRSSSSAAQSALFGSGRARSSKDDIKPRKGDIFSAHHKAKKRSVGEISKDDRGQAHQTQDVIGGVDESMLKRSKRKMEEKARLYAAMKRGDHVEHRRGYVNDEERGPLVDFDRKWAEKQGEESGMDTSSDEEVSESEGGKLVEYIDEFGRTRKATKAEVAREERKRRIQANAEEELAEMAARPKVPTNLIFGDIVQAAAFNPDAAMERQMEELAARRDRSVTPPEDTHYDATKEVRSKGVGFYQFSKENEQRKKEMENLGESRKQSEKWEEERRKNREKKEHDMDEDKRREQDRKSEREANAFLKSLSGGLTSFVAEGQDTNKKQKKGWGK